MVQSFYMAFENSEEWEHSADWGVYCARYRFPDATIKENKVNVVGSNGVIDLSSELTGDVLFNNVQGEIDFIILRDSNFDYLAFKNKYHGKRVKVMPDNDIEHYRIGRLSIKEDNNQDVLKRVYMVLDADPFRYAIEETEYIVPINTSALQAASECQSTNVYGGVTQAEDVFKIYNTTQFYETYLATPQGKILKINYALNIVWSFDTKPNKKYAVVVEFKTYIPAANSLNLYYEENYIPHISKSESHPYDLEIQNSVNDVLLTYTQLPQNANENKKIVFFFKANDNLSRLVFRARASRIKSEIKANTTLFEVSNLRIIEISEETSFKNNGRKALIPRLQATKSCNLIVNGQFSYLNENQEKKNFDLIVGTEIVNNFVAYGEEEGTVSIKYREAYL